MKYKSDLGFLHPDNGPILTTIFFTAGFLFGFLPKASHGQPAGGMVVGAIAGGIAVAIGNAVMMILCEWLLPDPKEALLGCLFVIVILGVIVGIIYLAVLGY